MKKKTKNDVVFSVSSSGWMVLILHTGVLFFMPFYYANVILAWLVDNLSISIDENFSDNSASNLLNLVRKKVKKRKFLQNQITTCYTCINLSHKQLSNLIINLLLKTKKLKFFRFSIFKCKYLPRTMKVSNNN